MITRRFAVAAFAVSLALGACSGQSAGQGALKPVRIIAGGTEVNGKYLPGGLTGVVAEQGWLKAELAKQGYDLQFQDMPHAIGGPMINEGFVNKTVEFAWYGDLPAVIGASAGAPLRLVWPSNAGTNTYLLVASGSPAKSLADLKGKRIALHRGRPWEAVFARYAADAGLKLADFKIYNVNPSAGAAALAGGKVDAFVGPIADAYRLQSQGAGRVLWSTKAAPRAWAQRTELFGRDDFIKDNPQAAGLVVAAYARAAQWASRDEHRDAFIAASSRETSEAAIRVDWEGAGPWKQRFSPFTTDGIDSHYQWVIDYAAETGLIKARPELARFTNTDLVAPAVKLAGADGWWPASPQLASATVRP
ncbi:ABC transporter substrate-binding protein [Phenylobacterium sp. LjRoot219]|uniref:ABC transporter substrate-binding protein n=1 Tax=Phenylobacterium sp. LjRoot219 TaxID=3342283 RepID=UPI003ECDF3B3